MRLEILVEEPSAEAALQALLPRLLPNEATFRIHAHQGKMDLLGKLPSRLKGYASWMKREGNFWILVLVDKDRDDCKELKARLEDCAREAGLLTKSRAKTGTRSHVVNRIAVEELEAWFLGDPEAVAAAYPRVPPTVVSRARFRHPDGVRGGTSEALEELLQDAGHHTTGLQKTRTAREIARHMAPERNRSPSFRAFCDGIRAINAAAAKPP